MNATLTAHEKLTLLAKFHEAQKMVQESQSTTASPYERCALARRVEWAADLGAQCLKAGLVKEM